MRIRTTFWTLAEVTQLACYWPSLEFYWLYWLLSEWRHFECFLSASRLISCRLCSAVLPLQFTCFRGIGWLSLSRLLPISSGSWNSIFCREVESSWEVWPELSDQYSPVLNLWSLPYISSLDWVCRRWVKFQTKGPENTWRLHSLKPPYFISWRWWWCSDQPDSEKTE